VKEAAMTIQWTPDLAVGVGEIDQQHRELYDRVNALLTAMAEGRGTQDVDETLRFLGEYVVRHFSMEEALMRRHRYPAYEAHKREHELFVEDFKRLSQKAAASGVRTTLVLEVQKQLGNWLRHHIGQVDRALGAFLKESATAAARH
jgi:hemerythrin